MIEKQEDIDTKYLYEYNKAYYNVLGTCKMKDVTTGNWLDAVVYRSLRNITYVRELNDFMSKFSVVQNINPL